MSDLLIRLRTEADLPALAEVLAAQQSLSRYPMRWPLPFPIERFVARDVDLAASPGELDGRPVGHVAAQAAHDDQMLPLWEAGHGRPREHLGVMGTLFVDPGVRRLGLGRRLHDIAVDWLRDHDLGPCLDVVPIHAAAQAMYAAAGWRVVGQERPHWLPDGEPDVLAMVLRHSVLPLS
ncbi:MAG: GNAT family N-acetyltransferase [Nocardioides sp.]